VNYLFCGRPTKNKGNGKTLSAVRFLLKQHIEEEKEIFSNIKLNNVEYTQLKPNNLSKVFSKKNVVVLLDEIHSIVHRNHSVHEACEKHGKNNIGLCYHLAEFCSQVRKIDGTLILTSQTYSGVHRQYRELLDHIILCEKYDAVDGNLIKCSLENKCDKVHYIRNDYYGLIDAPEYFLATPYYEMYNSYEVVSGWV